MPELPEVETMVRGIRPHVGARQLIEFRALPCRFRPISIKPKAEKIGKRMAGAVCTGVRRLGKRVVLDFDSGDSFVIEPRMTGLMLLHDPPDQEHLRVEWHFSPKAGSKASTRLHFWDRRGLGTVRLFSKKEFEREFLQDRLGPDPLEMSPPQWKQQLARTARALKVALLDQKLVAGIGNLYASEILHLCRLSPFRPANSLRTSELAKLHQAVLDVLLLAIKYEGSTLGDGTYRNVLNQNGSYQNQHRVYDRAGEICPTCQQAEVQRIVQAQRSTFYCPRCQAGPKSSRSR